jgi:hypothetical protein
MQTYGGMEVKLHTFLTPTVDRGKLLASRPGRLSPRGKNPGTQWIGGWVGPIDGLDFEAVEIQMQIL